MHRLDLVSSSYYSSFAVFNLNNFNNSTITIGANTNARTSIKFPIGKTGILNTCLKAGTTNIIIIKNAEAITAQINTEFPNIPVLNIEFLLSRILKT